VGNEDILRSWRQWVFLTLMAALLAAGGGFWLANERGAADATWALATVVALVPAVVWVVAALRRGRTGVDAIAVLALGGTLAVGEYLAGALIGLMLATGRAIEAYAERRAARDLRSLIEHAPQRARRRRADGGVEVVPLAEVVPGERLLVGPGDVVPVDGQCEDPAVLDESVLTGESMLVERPAGDPVASGAVNAGPAFAMMATATATDSTYADIVRLAQQATAMSAPTVRLADRYATWFLPAALLLAGLAWLASGEPVRAVAVLVVATPCPLLLAVPVAIVSGMSRAARRGVVVRGGGALETLARGQILLMDKTGTLTTGRPTVVDVVAAPRTDRDEVLRAAAAVEQVSPHVLATAIVRRAQQAGLDLPAPTGVREQPGAAVAGVVEGRTVRVGRLDDPPPPWAGPAVQRAALDSRALVWISIDGTVSGLLVLHDPLRPDAVRTVRRLREAGFGRLVMVSGDRRPVAEAVAAAVGIDEVVADCTPADKVAQVRRESERGVVVMVGDGVNDAPALAAADVGVAMAARGASAAGEIADAALTVDRIDRLADTVSIARRTRRIAVESAGVGMGLSLLAMGFAAVGMLPPAVGALLQEGIDVLVIANALRALGGRLRRRALPTDTHAMLRRFAAEHEHLRDVLAEVRDTADLIATGPHNPRARAALARVHEKLTTRVLPHEHAEEHLLYPALARPLGSREATTTMSRMHVEIDRLVARVGAHLRQAPGPTLTPGQVPDLLASLYGLDAVLRLHFTEEEENYFALVDQVPHREGTSGRTAGGAGTGTLG
jgi:heavy metal translocating P-type ATPase